MRLLARRLAFWIADTSSSLLIEERPATPRRRARSRRCFLVALALTPSALCPVGFGPPLRARSSEGPFSSLGSQWSPAFS